MYSNNKRKMLFAPSLKLIIGSKMIYSRIAGNMINRLLNDDELITELENTNNNYLHNHYLFEHPYLIINMVLLLGLFIWYNYDMIFQNRSEIQKLEKLSIFLNIKQTAKFVNIIFIIILCVFMKNVGNVY